MSQNKSSITSIALVATMLACMLAAVLLYYRERPETTAGQEVIIGGGFDLIDHRGQSFTSFDLRGRYALIFFGFTHCPDICPVTLANMVAALDQTPESITEQIRAVFITVDPERDTPDVMADYLAGFDAEILGLTGSPAQIREIIAAYKVYARKREPLDSADSSGYLMDHSGYIFVMDPEGNYLDHFSSGTSTQEMAIQLVGLIPPNG